MLCSAYDRRRVTNAPHPPQFVLFGKSDHARNRAIGALEHCAQGRDRLCANDALRTNANGDELRDHLVAARAHTRLEAAVLPDAILAVQL
jgi:hypothetical protein